MARLLYCTTLSTATSGKTPSKRNKKLTVEIYEGLFLRRPDHYRTRNVQKLKSNSIETTKIRSEMVPHVSPSSWTG